MSDNEQFDSNPLVANGLEIERAAQSHLTLTDQIQLIDPERQMLALPSKLQVSADLKLVHIPEHNIDFLSEGTINLMNLALANKIDAVFFLDKSARPAATLFMQTWKAIFPHKELPKIKFIRIGRGQNFDYNNIPTEVVEKLRQRYSLSDQSIMVVNEHTETGSTTVKAQQLFTRVFPDAKTLYTVAYPRPPAWHSRQDKIGVFDSNFESYEKENPLLSVSVFRWLKIYEDQLDLIDWRKDILNQTLREQRSELKKLAREIASQVKVVNTPSPLVI